MATSTNPMFSGIGQYTADKPAASTTPTSTKPSATPSSAYPAGSYHAPSPTPTSTWSARRTSTAPSSGRVSGGGRTLPSGSVSYWQPPKKIIRQNPITGASERVSQKPEMGALPEYMMPTFDQARVSELQELGMGAGMGQLRRGLTQSLTGSRYIENPNVRAMMERETMGGYGAGISQIRAGAGAEAWQRYMPEFQAAQTKAGAEYGAELGKYQTQFQADMADYMRQGKQITAPLLAEGKLGDLRWKKPRIV